MKFTASLLLLLLSFGTLLAQKDDIPFPKFSLLKMDSTTYLTNKDLGEKKNTVFINFSPTCDHCQRTIKSILDNIQKFKETQFVLTSFEDFASIRKFYFDNMLNSFSNVFIGQEKGGLLTSQIKYTAFPCAVLFDKNKTWIKKIEGETNAKVLLKALKIK
jgi:thiol-disulfide isomerase/thioredoxin